MRLKWARNTMSYLKTPSPKFSTRRRRCQIWKVRFERRYRRIQPENRSRRAESSFNCALFPCGKFEINLPGLRLHPAPDSEKPKTMPVLLDDAIALRSINVGPRARDQRGSDLLRAASGSRGLGR